MYAPPSDVNVGEHNPNNLVTSSIFHHHSSSLLYLPHRANEKHQKKHPNTKSPMEPTPQSTVNPPSLLRQQQRSRRNENDVDFGRGQLLRDFCWRGESPLSPSSSHLGGYSWDMNVISGWWLGHPSEKYACQLGWLFPIYGKIKHVPNHQPDMNVILMGFNGIEWDDLLIYPLVN